MDNIDYTFTLTSQYSHNPIVITDTSLQYTGDRYTKLNIQFNSGFGNEHANGVYNYELSSINGSIEKGLVKIITNPGGETGITNYTSTLDIENRVAEVFYRPNY
jgi:hypothetical protein